MIGAISGLMLMLSFSTAAHRPVPGPAWFIRPANISYSDSVRPFDLLFVNPSESAAPLATIALWSPSPDDDSGFPPLQRPAALHEPFASPQPPPDPNAPPPQEPNAPPTQNSAPPPLPPGVVPANSFAAMTPMMSTAMPPPKVQWTSVMGASLRYLGVMHSFRLMTEPATRWGLEHNPFWGGYLAALGAMHGWSDGDGYYENYLGHPIQGAVSGYIWIHNDQKYRNVEFGKDRRYWKSRLRAYAYAWAFSEQFEVGLLSEASIGQIQRYCCQFGFVDHVITPNGGMGWMVGEDILDKYVVRRIEDSTHNLGIRIASRIVLNPVQSFANFMNLEYPWYRENRGAPSHYDGSAAAFAASMQPVSTSEPQTYPLVPKFEITATLPSVMEIGNLSCLGGGGVAGFRVSDSWQWTAEVGGCTLGNSLPHDWSGDSLTFMSGPQWIRHTESRWSPHAHLRFGGQKVTLQQTFPSRRTTIENIVGSGSNLNAYYNLFNQSYESTGMSLSVGGGVDYRLVAGLALNVASLSYVHSWLDPVHNTDFNNGIRFSTGVVLRIGTW